jgi:hypothetical protein
MVEGKEEVAAMVPPEPPLLCVVQGIRRLRHISAIKILDLGPCTSGIMRSNGL